MDSDTDLTYIKGGTRLPSFVRANNSAEEDLFKFTQDEFVHQVIKTVSSFESILTQSVISRQCVLVLPSLSKWANFISKAVIRELYTSLTAIYIGPITDLRLVICHECLIQRKIVNDLLAMNMTKPGEKNEDGAVAKSKQEKSTVTISEEMSSNLIGCDVSMPSWDCSLAGSRPLEKPILKDTDILKTYQPIPDDTWTTLLHVHLIDILDSVGSVWIMKPNWAKEEGVTDICPCFASGDVDHALEVFNFPPSFVTEDLNKIFKEFESTGFTIFWTDDTHAVIRFSSKEIALRALESTDHAIVRCRPIAEASRQTKIMLAKSSEKRLPFKRRPPTESNTAKRLILSSLGIRQEPRRTSRGNEN